MSAPPPEVEQRLRALGEVLGQIVLAAHETLQGLDQALREFGSRLNEIVAERPGAATAAPGGAEGSPTSSPQRPAGGDTRRRAPVVQGEWTAERRALLTEAWTTGVPAPEILQRINALPGRPIGTVHAAQVRAGDMGLRRPEGWHAEVSREGLRSIPRPEPRAETWTPERVALLAELRHAGVPFPEVRERLAGLPGAPIGGEDAVRKKAFSLGLKLGPDAALALRQANVEKARATRAASRAAKASRAGRMPQREDSAPEPQPAAALPPAAPAGDSAPAAPPEPPAYRPAAGAVAALSQPLAILPRDPPPPAAEDERPPPEIVERKLERAHEKARALLSRGAEVGEVVAATRLQEREVRRLLGEVREQRRQAAAREMA